MGAGTPDQIKLEVPRSVQISKSAGGGVQSNSNPKCQPRSVQIFMGGGVVGVQANIPEMGALKEFWTQILPAKFW